MMIAETFLIFLVLTLFFSEALKFKKNLSKTPALEKEASGFLDVDEEHRRAIEEFDRLLQDDDPDTDIVLSAPLRTPSEVAEDFVAGWVRYLIVLTYQSDIKWDHYNDYTHNRFDSRSLYTTEVTLAGNTYDIMYEMGAFRTGIRVHNIEIKFDSGKKFKGECPLELGDDLYPLAKASARGHAAPAEMLEIMTHLKEKI